MAAWIWKVTDGFPTDEGPYEKTRVILDQRVWGNPGGAGGNAVRWEE